MASGRPDFHPSMLLEGKYGTSLIPVKVDSSGQMYIIMTGAGGIVVNLDAAGNIIAHMVGYDGTNLRDVKTDVAGNIIARMQGMFGATLQDVALDANGFMQAVIKGLFGATLKTIAVDTNGVMLANLSAQDLDFLRVRPVYGQMRVNSSSKVVTSGAGLTELFTVTGRGAILGGMVYWTTGDISSESIALYVDTVQTVNVTPYWLMDHAVFAGADYPLSICQYNTISPEFGMYLKGGTTFESSFAVYAAQVYGSDITFLWKVHYALVPT